MIDDDGISLTSRWRQQSGENTSPTDNIYLPAKLISSETFNYFPSQFEKLPLTRSFGIMNK